MEVSDTSIGGEATILCYLASGTKPVQFIWAKDGEDVNSQFVTSLQTSSTLVIPTARIEDRGRYTCKVKSPFGEDVKSADLVIKGELNIDLLVSKMF
jgi:hypothetical protein